MSKVPKDLFEEARKRGIVPGAVIQCAAANNRRCLGTVDDVSNWELSDDTLWVGTDSEGSNLCGRNCTKKWAKVITSAQSQAVGLKEGDAIACGPAMRSAIIELAKELGVDYEFGGNPNQHWVVYETHRNRLMIVDTASQPKLIIKVEEFIAKMRVTAALPKPIMIGDRAVKFNSDQSITVGCTTVDFATIEEVYNRLKKS